MAFPDAAFDIVAFSYNGLDAVGFEDRHVVLDEVARVLAPGGVFAFSSLNRDGPGYANHTARRCRVPPPVRRGTPGGR